MDREHVYCFLAVLFVFGEELMLLTSSTVRTYPIPGRLTAKKCGLENPDFILHGCDLRLGPSSILWLPNVTSDGSIITSANKSITFESFRAGHFSRARCCVGCFFLTSLLGLWALNGLT